MSNNTKIIMHKLDDKKRITRLDQSGIASSIESLGLQFRQAWEEATKIVIPKSYRKIDTILINGMGGSALGGHIIEALYGEKLSVPIKVINSYVLPGFVDSRTLYIISSYSGTTEEPISTFHAARKRKAKILLIGAGGTIAHYAKHYRVPAYIFKPQFNPSNQPRMGLGYSIAGQLAMLKRDGLLKVGNNEMKKVIDNVVGLHRKFGIKVPFRKNEAKKIAQKLYGKIPIIIGAGHLTQNAHVLANQINENSKVFSMYFVVPELNHHLMEGMRFPVTNKKQLHFLCIESSKYLKKVQKRFVITKKVLSKNSIHHSTYTATGATKLHQVFELLVFGSYMNFYMSMLYGIDPAPIPYVDYFKKQLAQ